MNPASKQSADFRLDGKSVVVTGGARGIGQAIAVLFASRGASIHILDADVEGAAATVKHIIDNGCKASSTACDVANSAGTLTVFEDLARRAPIDILVNSAGIAHVGNLESTSEADFDNVFQVNVKGIFNCMRAVITHMKRNRAGVILNLASIAATAGLSDRFAYSASKGAVLSMTLSVAKDYLPYNIRCNCISPARVHTPFVDGFIKKNYPGQEDEMFARLSQSQPIGRMAKPEEVASLALFLCCDASSFLTGADYPFDGGFFNLRG